MATLQELLDLEGVVVAGEFDFEGRMLDYEALEIDMSEEMAQMTAQFCAAVSVMLNTLASSFAERHELGASTRLGVLSGGEWTACIGDGGRRGVLVETSKADFNNKLFEDLGDERQLERERACARRA
jgi:roadblock/LC7 domain-containing protein